MDVAASGAGAEAAVVELVRQVRGFSIQLMEAAEEGALLWTPAGIANHMVWHAGHGVWVVDVLCVVPLAGRSELPAGFAGKFGQHSRPGEVREWPGRGEILALQRSQLERVVGLLGEHGERIAREGFAPSRGWGLMPGILHGLHDEARHSGEMYLLLKMWRGAGRGGG